MEDTITSSSERCLLSLIPSQYSYTTPAAGLACQKSFPVQAENRAKELQKLGIKVKILTVGKKGGTYFKRRSDKYNIAGWPPANKACKQLLS